MDTMHERFITIATRLLDDDPGPTVAPAEISRAGFDRAPRALIRTG
ncbi:transketolase [Streptomyces sp. 136MFCol5.1]|nr:transketolase [Streptomyces sp. 136MFCol5.1]SFS47483.1 transketolase [Streptomyces sp. ok210]